MKSAKELADELGVTSKTITRLARELGLERKYAILLVDEAEEKLIRQRCRGRVGNPNFVPGNRFGVPPKPATKPRKRKVNK